jgi:hypothetical protein
VLKNSDCRWHGDFGPHNDFGCAGFWVAQRFNAAVKLFLFCRALAPEVPNLEFFQQTVKPVTEVSTRNRDFIATKQNKKPPCGG